MGIYFLGGDNEVIEEKEEIVEISEEVPKLKISTQTGILTIAEILGLVFFAFTMLWVWMQVM
jgi:hypothetical protein